MALDKVRYTTEVIVKGGRSGTAVSDDGNLDVKLVMPKEMGGNGADKGTNPEQLFGAGFAACFLGAMGLVAGKKKIEIPKDTFIAAEVSFGTSGDKLGLALKLGVSLPGMDRAKAEELVELAHHTCPYSHATRNNIDVTLVVSV